VAVRSNVLSVITPLGASAAGGADPAWVISSGPAPSSDPQAASTAVALLEVSQTPDSDAERLLHAVASLAVATLQGMVPTLSRPELRSTVMQIGAVHARVATVFARIISPENVVTLDDFATAAPAAAAAASTTTVETGLPTTVGGAPAASEAAVGPADIPVYQVPSAFGSLAPVQIVLGDTTEPDGPTKRVQLNIETPSLNSLMYDDA